MPIEDMLETPIWIAIAHRGPPLSVQNASSRARAGGEGRFRVGHCSADNSRITLSTYRLARGRRVHSSAVSSRQAARYSSEIRCRSATKLARDRAERDDLDHQIDQEGRQWEPLEDDRHSHHLDQSCTGRQPVR